MSAPASRFSSPRFQRKLLWAGGVVLAVGAVVVVATFVWTSPKAKPVAKGNGRVVRPTKDVTVKFDPAAQKVGERFIETAVARKNLAASWQLVAPDLKSDFTLRRWESGNIPVVPYPADTSRKAPVKIEYSYKDRVLLLILLEPKRGDKTKPQLFHLGLHAFGTGKARHWLVDYWAPYGVPKVPSG
jgi:hypothetical protein